MDIMWPFYYLAIQLYKLIIRFSAGFNDKAHDWFYGRRELAPVWKKLKDLPEQRIWVHCASLGEFEQGKPLMEDLRVAYPNYKIVLTFFSPSGYQIRKNTPVADYVFYMPLDGPSASRNFINAINPKMVFFVKYEFWYFYGKYLSQKKIPFFCVSAIFRENQIFFKWYGGFFRQMLLRFTHVFVQDQASLKLLYKHSISKVTVIGDTRFDAVCKIADGHNGLSEIKKFKLDNKLVVLGSAWEPDIKVVDYLIENTDSNVKFIIAPHEIKEDGILKMERNYNGKAIRYSDWIKNPTGIFKILIIDNVGLLSRIYKFADYTFIGGGFGAGIHNILEAAVFGMPVFFGPNYKKFKEAVELVKSESAFSVNDANELLSIFNRLEKDLQTYNHCAETNKKYVESRKGATKLVIDYLQFNLIS